MLRKLSPIVLTALLLAPLWVWAKPTLPVNWQGLAAPYDTRSATNPPRAVPRPEGAKLAVPPGFKVEEYASNLDGARYMIAGTQGEVLVSSMSAGAVYVLDDKRVTTLIDNLDRPYGLTFYKDWLYVAEPVSVKRFKYASSTSSLGKPEEVISLKGLDGGHTTRTVLFNQEENKLYLSVGSKSNVSLGEPPMRAAISRFDPDGSNREIFASGIRNAVGLRWYPGTDQLWVTNHERDALGDDLVPDFLTSVKQGDFFGWPYAYIGPHEDPRHPAVAPRKVKQTRYPDVLLGSHVGALDLLFYTGKQFPKKYQGGCFVALHGSWNRSQRVGYKIAFVPFKDGRPVAGPENFVSGWMMAPDRREVWGRPVGLLQLADGSLLISDDGADKIWRVSYSR